MRSAVIMTSIATGVMAALLSWSNGTQAFHEVRESANSFPLDVEQVPGEYIVVLNSEYAAKSGERGSRKPSVRTVADELARTHSVAVLDDFSHALPGFLVEADVDSLRSLLKVTGHSRPFFPDRV